ncbi:MAG: hypothetical protein ACREQI_08445 [Candidatus Binataceae bacterium]
MEAARDAIIVGVGRHAPPPMAIYEQVLSFIHNPRPDSFEGLALAVFRHQFDAVPAYRRFCLERGIGADGIPSVAEIPAVAAAAFKFADLSGGDGGAAAKLSFLTSGTTRGKDRRGRHVVPHPEIYRASAIMHLRSMLYPDARRSAMLALHPAGDAMPESSLAAMIGWAIEEFGSGAVCAAATRAGVDTAAAARFLAGTAARGEPAGILGTTAAIRALFDYLRERGEKIPLASGSRIMDTGGAKGQAAPMTRLELLRGAKEILNVAPEMVINEYGMTELCSQLYDATPFNTPGAPREDDRFKVAPPWMRAIVRDPAGLEPLPDGELGLLSFFDLANVGSVSAVLTEDYGVADRDRVRLLGRAAAGPPRGCALGIAQFAAAGE